MIHRHFRKHERIWDEGDDASFYAIIVSGAVKLTKMVPDGRQQIIAIQFPSDFLGNLIFNERISFAEAATDTELCCFPKRDFEKALRQVPEIEHALLEKAFQDLAQAQEWMVTLGRKNATEKIATFLVSLMKRAEKFTCKKLPPTSNNIIIEVPMSRSEIADYLGLTLETVSRQFSRLKKRGIIQLHHSNKIEITNPSELCRLTGD